jgi:hypothetical protein
MQSNLDALNRIAGQSADLAEQGRTDSKTLKALTLIATMYLPATLMAVRSLPCTAEPRLDEKAANVYGNLIDLVQLQLDPVATQGQR